LPTSASTYTPHTTGPAGISYEYSEVLQNLAARVFIHVAVVVQSEIASLVFFCLCCKIISKNKASVK
jgi:hypothetical protein